MAVAPPRGRSSTAPIDPRLAQTDAADVTWCRWLPPTAAGLRLKPRIKGSGIATSRACMPGAAPSRRNTCGQLLRQQADFACLFNATARGRLLGRATE